MTSIQVFEARGLGHRFLRNHRSGRACATDLEATSV
jgi:hypothetical protein